MTHVLPNHLEQANDERIIHRTRANSIIEGDTYVDKRAVLEELPKRYERAVNPALPKLLERTKKDELPTAHE